MISLVKNSIYPETAKYFLHFPIFCPLREHPPSLRYSSAAFAIYITVSIQKINACMIPENQSK